MEQAFLEDIEKNLDEKSVKHKWEKKTSSFLENFVYLNTELMIQDQMQRLLCVGVNSMASSAELIKNLTSDNLEIMDVKLKAILADLAQLAQRFDLLEKTINQKKGLFSFKEPVDMFFEIFKKEEQAINDYIKELSIKQVSLGEVKNSLEEGMNKLFDTFVLLHRDTRFLTQAQEKFKNHDKELVCKVYKEHEFELTQIKTDLLTQQHIIFQKYAAMRILVNSVKNCYKNITFITRVTYAVIMNIVELQNIIKLKKSQLSERDMESLKKLKESLTVTNTDMQLIAAQPFEQHVE